MSKIPQQIRVLFWDTNPENLEYKKHKKYIIERILEYGDLSADVWLNSIYSEKDIIETVKTSKRISLLTAHFYSIVFNFEKTDTQAFKDPNTPRSYQTFNFPKLPIETV